MKIKTMIVIMAALSLIWGVGFIIAPTLFWSLYGLDLDAGGVYMSRQLGVVFFMLGLMLWLIRNVQSSMALKAICVSLFVGNIVGFVVALFGQLTTDISVLGWIGVLSYLLLALGFGYCLVKPASFGNEALSEQ